MHVDPHATRYRTAFVFTVHTERHDLSETAVSTALTFMQQFHNSKALERKEKSPLRASIPQGNLEKIAIFLGHQFHACIAMWWQNGVACYSSKKKMELCIRGKNKPQINFRMKKKKKQSERCDGDTCWARGPLFKISTRCSVPTSFTFSFSTRRRLKGAKLGGKSIW